MFVVPNVVFNNYKYNAIIVPKFMDGPIFYIYMVRFLNKT